jgi:hypothetical protein
MEIEISRKTEKDIKKRKRTRFTPSVIVNITLIVGVLALIAMALYAPRTDFFKGALSLRPSAAVDTIDVSKPSKIEMPGALLIDYIKKSKDIVINGELITLTSFVLEAEYEEMTISSFLFEFEGVIEPRTIIEPKLLVDGHELSSSNYIWISPTRLLVEVSREEVLLSDRLTVMLQGIVNIAQPGQTIKVFVSDISATGRALKKAIRNIGVKGEIDAAGTALHIQ